MVLVEAIANDEDEDRVEAKSGSGGRLRLRLGWAPNAKTIDNAKTCRSR